MENTEKSEKRKSDTEESRNGKRIKNEDEPEVGTTNFNGDLGMDVDNEIVSEERPNGIGDVPNEAEAEVEEEIEFPTLFDIKQFRNKLHGEDFIKELRHFLHLHKKGKRVVQKYLEKKGTPLELSEAFKRIDQKNVYHVAHLAEALRIVLEHVSENEPDERDFSAETCRFFYKSNSGLLKMLLKSRNAEHRKTCIGLMMVICVLAPGASRTLLNCFDVYRDAHEVKAYLSHKVNEEDVTVREVFIKFILSLLVDGTTFVIRVLLDKYELIAITLFGLVYDDYEVVVSVLTAFKKCVLESMLISKTKKVRVFDLPNVISLLHLYDWKGPAYFKASAKTKPQDLINLIEPTQKKVVKQCVNDFLILLLSRRRYGLAFDAMANLGQRKNAIQQKTLASLPKPWDDPLKKQLVIEILLACPELAEGMIRNMSNRILILTDESLPILIFISEIVAALSPEVMRSGLEQISLNRFARWVKELCLPQKVLNVIRGKMLLSPEMAHRGVSVRTLAVLFRQYCKYMLAIIEREKLKGNELRKFRLEMLEYMFLYFPTVDKILLSLFVSVEAKSSNLLEHMNDTFDLLMSMCRANRSFVNKTAEVIQYVQLMDSMLESLDDPETIAVKTKGMKLLLMLNPNMFLPSLSSYSKLVEDFCLVFMNDRSNKLNVGPILQKLLLNSNVFSNGPLEVDIWLEAMRFVDRESVPHVAKCWKLVESQERVDMAPYQNVDYVSKTNLKGLFRDIENGVAVEGYVDLPVMSEALVLMLQNLNDHPNCKPYFEIVSLLLFHFIPAPKHVQEVYSSHFESYHKYMLAWLSKRKPGKMVAGAVPRFAEMYLSVVEGRSNFQEVFKGDEKFLLNGVELSLEPILRNKRYIMLLIYQTCFVVSQLTVNRNLELIQADAAAHYIDKLLHVLELNDASVKEEIAAFDVNPSDEVEAPYVEQALKYIFSMHLPLLQSFTVLGKEAADRHFAKFVCSLAEATKDLDLSDFMQLAVNYCSKIVNQVGAAVCDTLESNTTPPFEPLLTALDAFRMSEENCLKLLERLAPLKAEHYMIDAGNRSAYFDVMVFALNRLAASRKVFQEEKMVSQIGDIYAQLLRQVRVLFSLEKLEEALYNFLKISHPCIRFLSTDVFLSIFENTRISKSTVKFASLLMIARKDLAQEFLVLLPKQVSRKELIYPLLNILVVAKTDLDKDLLKTVYQECKGGIMKAIEKPQKAAVIYKENVEASMHLLQNCMPKTDFYKTTLKLETVEVFQLRMVEAIYQKEMEAYADKASTQGNVVTSFLNNLMQCLIVVMKREPLDALKVSSICYHIYQCVVDCKTKEVAYDVARVVATQQWENFCKTCLKFGMRGSEAEERDVAESDDKASGLLLKLLGFLFDEFYSNGGNDDYVATCFEMVMSHSRFFDIVFTKRPSHVKTQVMHLLLVLAQKNSSVAKQKCLPILLGAYQAKLSDCDRFTLALMQHFQQCGIVWSKSKPLLWGESAIEQYSLREEKQTLHQERSLTNTMSLVERHVSDFTIDNFPIWRSIDTLAQLPAVEFENPHLGWSGWGSSALHREVEAGRLSFDKTSLKNYPIAQEVLNECYDPAFMIPLLNRHLGGGNVAHPVSIAKNGLLQIAFAALSSLDVHMRMAAGLVHVRYRETFESNIFLDKQLWTTAYENVQTGLAALAESWKKYKTVAVPRVPYVSGLFLAVAMSTLVEPLDPMYKVLSMYLRVKAKFEFLCVPEFLVLFHSSDVDHSTQRKFVLDIIRNGVKCSSDLFLLVTTGTLKSLMGFYDVPVLSPPSIRLKILAVFGACVKIPVMLKCLIENIGLLVWLSAVIQSAEFFQFDTLEAIIEIVSDIWYGTKATEQSAVPLARVELHVFQLAVKLMPLISSRLSLEHFAQFANVLARTAEGRHQALNEKSLEQIIECARRHLPDHIWGVRNIMQYGIECVESSDAYRKSLEDDELSGLKVFTLLNLRNLVIRWKEVVISKASDEVKNV